MRRSSLALAVVVVSGIVVASPAAAALEQTPERGGTVVFGPVGESSCLNPFRDCGGSGPQYGWILTKVLPRPLPFDQRISASARWHIFCQSPTPGGLFPALTGTNRSTKS